MWRRGELLTRLIDDIDSFAGLITRALIPLMSIAVVMSAAVLVTGLIDPASGMLLAIVIACTVAVA